MVVTRKIMNNLKNEIRNWTRLEVVVGIRKIQRKHDINNS